MTTNDITSLLVELLVAGLLVSVLYVLQDWGKEAMRTDQQWGKALERAKSIRRAAWEQSNQVIRTLEGNREQEGLERAQSLKLQEDNWI
jgi:hypothetical protein